jgi:hypothetical protein
VRERHGVRHKQLIDDLPEKWKYWKLREESLWKRLWTCHKTDHTLMNEWIWRSTNAALLKGQLMTSSIIPTIRTVPRFAGSAASTWRVEEFL